MDSIRIGLLSCLSHELELGSSEGMGSLDWKGFVILVLGMFVSRGLGTFSS